MPINVHLCCGTHYSPGWINVDLVPLGQDVVADLSKPWDFLKTATVDRLYIKDGFEHQRDLGHFLRESARVLRPGGTLEIWVPHFKNPSAYRITHTHYFSWSLWDVFPEPHDVTQALEVVVNRLYVGQARRVLWAPVHWLINLMPRWYERLGYVSNIQVILRKRAA